MKKYFLTLSLLAISLPALAVVNGTKVSRKSIGTGGAEDYAMGLRIESKDARGDKFTNYCTAVIIAPNALLTAGHCVKDRSATVRVVKGINADGASSLSIKKIYLKSDYDKSDVYAETSLGNDIAIIRLRDEVPKSYKAARLPSLGETLSRGLNLNVIGIGRGSLTSKSYSRPDYGILRKGINNSYTISSGSILLNQSAGGAGLCEGDSGGPLLQQNAEGGFTVWGLARTVRSAGLNQEQRSRNKRNLSIRENPQEFLDLYPELDYCKGTGQYTDIRGYMNWIKANLPSIVLE